jgi:type 1 glutamine amidotransferase
VTGLVAGAASAAAARVLVFTKTGGYRHASIPNGIQAIRTLGAQNGFDVDATEDESAFTAANLARYDAVVFLLTSGDVLGGAGQAAFEAYIRGGGSYVGVHSASDTERDWPWYGRLVGAFSSGHPEIQEAAIVVAEPRDASTTPLPARWTRTDEWYGFLTNPRTAGVRVLLTLDETSYLARDWAMSGDHPIAWSHLFDGGRAWYTAGGHTEESYSEPLFLQHLLGGIRFALDKPSTSAAGASTAAGASPAAKPARPAIARVSLTVQGRRVAARVTYTSCGARCSASLRIRSQATKLKLSGIPTCRANTRCGRLLGVASGTSPALPTGRWRATVTFADAASGLSRTVTRWVRIPRG